MTDTEHIQVECPACGGDIVIDKVFNFGGVNRSGGYVLKCQNCENVFHFDLGQDISLSRVKGGADVLDIYDDSLGNKAEVLKRHGLSSED